MTLELLKSYRSKKDEVKELTYKLEHLGEGDSLVGNDVIFDYRSGFPVPKSVIGVDRNKYYSLKSRWGSRREQLIKECEQVEEYVEDIPDSLTRRIFRMHFIDGYTQKQIAHQVHMDRSTITKKIDNFLKVSPNSPKTTL